MKIKEKPVYKTLKGKPSKTNKIKSKSKSLTKSNKKIDISKLSVNEFVSSGFEDKDEETTLDSGAASRNKNGKQTSSKVVKKEETKGCLKTSVKTKMKKKGDKVKSKKKVAKENDSKLDEADDEEEIEGDSEESDDDLFKKHRKDLDGLKNTDPEFYNFLKENDQDLLNFEDSDSDGNEGEDEEEKCHTAPDSLEVASDEDDYTPEDGIQVNRSDRSITMAMISSWQERLPSTKNRKVLRDVVDAFHAAVLRVSVGDDQLFRFKVEGSTVFNAIIRMCVVDIHSGLRSILKLPEGSRTPPTQSRLWTKVKPLLKTYFEDLVELAGVTSPSMLTVLLKHIHQMVPFLIYFPNIGQRAMRRLIDLWSKSEDVVRVLSFLCLLRMTNRNHSFLSTALKKMYITYVKNTKFVSPNTLPEINFMRQSLTEMFALDDTVSYQMAFVYIRQLAVHLRNAVTLKKKENFQTVYNWQFVSSLQLWSDLFGLVPDGSPLRSLVYPLAQIVIGTIKLIPSSQYYPLRFHCCKILVNLSNKCGVFIPVLPFLLEILQDFDFNREHKKLSMKPMDLTCLLRCSKIQMKENGFKDALMENINNLLIEAIGTECHRISFPDVFVPTVVQLKQFIKQCKVVNYTKMMKAILEKINENSKFIESERKNLNFKLNDVKTVEAIETGIRAKGTPFLTYYNNWKKIYMQQQAKKVVDSVKVGDFKLPVIYKGDRKRSREQSRSVGPPELFPSDDDDGDDDDDVGVDGTESDASEMEPDESDDDDDDDDDEGMGKKKKKCKKEVKKKGKTTRMDLKRRKGRRVDEEAAPEKKPKKSVKKVRRCDDEEEDVVEDLKLSDIE